MMNTGEGTYLNEQRLMSQCAVDLLSNMPQCDDILLGILQQEIGASAVRAREDETLFL